VIDPLVNSFFCVCLQHFNVLPIVLDFFALMQGLGTHLGGWGRIISPKFPEGIYKCFYFAYHMFGEEMGRLEIVAEGMDRTTFRKNGME